MKLEELLTNMLPPHLEYFIKTNEMLIKSLEPKKHLEEVDNGEGDRAYEERVDNELSDHD